MATLLIKNVLWRVSSTLVDTNPQYSRYTERDMVMALQNAVKALCKYLPYVGAQTIAMKLQPGTLQTISKITAAGMKSKDGSASRTVYGIRLIGIERNMGADGVSPGRVIPIGDRLRMDRLDPMWHTRTGTEVRQYFYNQNTPLSFWVTPAVPPAQNVWVDLSLVAPPEVIQDGGLPGSERYAKDGGVDDPVGIDDQFEDEIWNYCVAYLLLSNSQAPNAVNRAMVHVNAFNASVNSLVTVLTGQNPNLQSLPFGPADSSLKDS